MFVAPPIYVPADADSQMVHAKHAEMQSALERVRDAAELWFSLSVKEQDRLREEWTEQNTAGKAESEKSAPRAATAAEG